MNRSKMLAAILSITVVTGCANTNNNDTQEPSKSPIENDTGIHSPTEDQATENPSDTDDSNEAVDDNQASSENVEQEQKQMAMDALNGLADNAKAGKVYRLSDGIYVGKSTRDDVVKLVGEPEEKDDFDHYHGSMGNASYDLAYDDKGVLKEARYFGTNVERQTNLGGITKDDLIEQLGKPAETHQIPETGETNYRYHFGDFELQFVMGKDGKADHVNLKKWS